MVDTSGTELRFEVERANIIFLRGANVGTELRFEIEGANIIFLKGTNIIFPGFIL